MMDQDGVDALQVGQHGQLFQYCNFRASPGLAHRLPGFPRRQYYSTSDSERILPEVAKPAFSSAALCRYDEAFPFRMKLSIPMRWHRGFRLNRLFVSYPSVNGIEPVGTRFPGGRFAGYREGPRLQHSVESSKPVSEVARTFSGPLRHDLQSASFMLLIYKRIRYCLVM
jgi:hypothetical protein